MEYSADLIWKVKELYPNSPEMHRLADNGHYFLGRYLDDSSNNSIPVDTVLLATSLEELQKIARHEKLKGQLYKQWYDETRAWPRG